jgi:uncharacterized protein YabE (DUF348 family)/3D (Asp-Asp-Asp) domain-containing protein
MPECNRLVTGATSKPLRFVALLLPVICIVLLLSQTVFAKNTYLINDSGKVVIHTTYATDPAKVLDEAGLELGEDDTFVTQTGFGVSEITVQRKQSITINHGGNVLDVVSYGETVESLLERLDLILTNEDVVSVPLSSQTFDGLNITIARSVEVEETYTTVIPFEITYCDDPTLPKGEEVVLTEGVNGQMLCKANVVYVSGEEVSRTVLSEAVTIEPVNAVIAVGTGESVKPHRNDLPSNLIRPQFTGKPVIGDGYIITPDGEYLTYTHSDVFKATAYNNADPGCTEYNYIGTKCRVGAIAVDPSVIPYGTRMFIVTNDGKYVYGIATAEDCGSAIKGKRVDLYFDTVAECDRFGIRNCTIYFLG